MFRFGETVLDVIEKTSKIDMYQNKTEKYSALTPDIRIHYQTVYKYVIINYILATKIILLNII